MVSIIVPVYNVENYLEKCVNSLLHQTCRDIEILLIDDGSTDSSGDICDELQKKHPAVVRVFHNPNGGVSAARNTGLKHACGDYVGFVDSDDWVEPEMFEVLLSNIVRCNAQMSICALMADTDEKELTLHKTDRTLKLSYSELMDAFLRDESILGYACNKLFVTELARETAFDETLCVSEDLDFCVRYALSINDAVATPSQLYHYRQRHGSMTGEFTFSYKKLTIIQAFNSILQIYKLRTPELSYIIEKYLLKQHLNVIGRMTISKVDNPVLKQELWSGVKSLWPTVMREKRNSSGEKANILLTRLFPATMLRIKQWVIKRHYK